MIIVVSPNYSLHIESGNNRHPPPSHQKFMIDCAKTRVIQPYNDNKWSRCGWFTNPIKKQCSKLIVSLYGENVTRLKPVTDRWTPTSQRKNLRWSPMDHDTEH